MEYGPQYWTSSETSLYEPAVLQHENMYADCYSNYQLMSNGEYLMTTGRDFLDYPLDNDVYFDEDALSYCSTDDEEIGSPSHYYHHHQQQHQPQQQDPIDINNETEGDQQEDQPPVSHQIEKGEELPVEPPLLSPDDPTDSTMDTKKQSSSPSHRPGYPPPPLSEPPRLHSQNLREHRSPPAGGSRRSSSPPTGTRKTHSTSGSKSQPHLLSTPSGHSPSSSPPAARSNSTTPTNELGERGSPAGSSVTNSSINNNGGQTNKSSNPPNQPSRIPKSIDYTGVGRTRGSLTGQSFHGSVKTLYNPDSGHRISPPRLSSQLPESRSEIRLFKPARHPGFTRRHTVSVAERIAQFGGQRANKGIPIHRTYSPDRAIGGGIGGLDPYKDIEDEVQRQRNSSGSGTGKGSVVGVAKEEGGGENQDRKSERQLSSSDQSTGTTGNVIMTVKSSTPGTTSTTGITGMTGTTVITGTAGVTGTNSITGTTGITGTASKTSIMDPNNGGNILPLTTSPPSSSPSQQSISPTMATNHHRPVLSSYPLAQPDRQDDLISPTSSIEELSFINQQRRDLPKSGSHDSLAPPTNHQPYRVVFHSHQQQGYPIQQPHPQKVVHQGGSTFLPRPPQPLANVPPPTSSSVHSSYPTYQTEHHGELPGHAHSSVMGKNTSQPLGITTANLALAQNAAAKGDLSTLRSLLSNGDIDPVDCSHFGANLLHMAASNGQLQVLQLLGKEVSPTAFQVADSNYLTPAMLAIQGGHVDCLKWLVEEGGVSLTVPDAGGETLLHHAAFNGQEVCLEYLLHRLDTTSEQVSYVDESGVTPAHFAAQRGHIDCLSLLINYNYDVVMPDRENQKPLDWADAMGHRTCTHYLLMYGMCWQLSREVAMLSQQVQRLCCDNEQLYNALKSRDKEHNTEIAQLLKQHQATIQKVHEKYANYTVSLLLNETKDQAGNNVGVVTSEAPPTDANKIPTTVSHSVKDSVPIISIGSENIMDPGNHPGTSCLNKDKKDRSKPPPLEIPPSTPDEVLKRQLSSVEQQLFANRQVRKLNPMMATRSFSPLSPVLKKMSLSQEKLMEEAMNNSSEKEKRSVTFAPSVTEYIVEGSPSGNNHQSNKSVPISSAHQYPPPPPTQVYKPGNSSNLIHSTSQSPPILTKNIIDDDLHQPYPPSFHPHNKPVHYNMGYQTTTGSGQPPIPSESINVMQQQSRSHSQNKSLFGSKDIKPGNVKQGHVFKSNELKHNEDDFNNKQQLPANILSQTKHTTKQQQHSGNSSSSKQPVGGGISSSGNPSGSGSRTSNLHQQKQETIAGTSQKSTQLQQQVMRLQQMENLKQSKQGDIIHHQQDITSSSMAATSGTTPSLSSGNSSMGKHNQQHIHHPQTSSSSRSNSSAGNIAGPSILYRPMDGSHSAKKRSSMPLPMTTNIQQHHQHHPSSTGSHHHRASVPMQRVTRTSKDMGHGATGLIPSSGMQPHPLTMSQGAGGSRSSAKHSVAYK